MVFSVTTLTAVTKLCLRETRSNDLNHYIFKLKSGMDKKIVVPIRKFINYSFS